MKIDTWENCYNDGWQKLIVPEAYQHPAKMAHGLLRRILAHATQEGWIAPGGIIVDPFGGIGSTGILGAYESYQVVCVELEQKFVDLAEQNFKLHDNAWRKLGCPRPVMIQGDSRKLSEIIGQAECIVSNPPYANAGQGAGEAGPSSGMWKGKGKQERYTTSEDSYGSTPGQLGQMKPGSVEAIISSPPYEGCPIQGGGDCMTRKTREIVKNTGEWPKRGLSVGNVDVGYGKSDGQLGNSQGDTFWSATRIIVQQCHQILKPGGYAIWVVKHFVRKGKLVDFPGDWRRLCESVGFETLHEHHASLVKEDTKDDLFGGTITKRKERKSFFRRLAEKKGSPRIDFETVYCMRKTPNDELATQEERQIQSHS